MVKFKVFPPLENNCYLLVDDATNQSALIDCSAFNGDMLDLIGETDLKYILLTHGHFDHIGGVNGVKEKFGCKVAIGEKDSHMQAADILLSDGDIITLGETEIRVIATPGHTKGGVCYIAGGSLFTGDTLFRLSCGRTDFEGGSVPEMMQSLKKLAALEGDFTVYPGHEEFSTLAYERQFNPYMNYDY